MILGVVAAIYLASFLGSTPLPGNSATPPRTPSNPRAAARRADAAAPVDLDVRLEALKQPRPAAQGIGRNPFRFYVKPPPAAPSSGGPGATFKPPPPRPDPVDPSAPLQPPAISLKYFGFMDTPSGKIASFSDCRVTMRGREGEIIAGQYRLVRIGAESAVMEYPDGRGRTTIRLSGQECVGK
jgi:hypothetical protein